jgi:hypothetical protein
MYLKKMDITYGVDTDVDMDLDMDGDTDTATDMDMDYVHVYVCGSMPVSGPMIKFMFMHTFTFRSEFCLAYFKGQLTGHGH